MGNYRHHGYPYQLTSFFWGEDRGVLTLLNREWPEAGEFLMLQACNLSDFVLNHPRFKPGKVSTDISPKSGSIVFFETYINIWTQLLTREPQCHLAAPGQIWAQTCSSNVEGTIPRDLFLSTFRMNTSKRFFTPFSIIFGFQNECNL